MAIGMMLVTVLFACVVGHALAANNYSPWSVAMIALAMWLALPASYVFTSLLAFNR